MFNHRTLCSVLSTQCSFSPVGTKRHGRQAYKMHRWLKGSRHCKHSAVSSTRMFKCRLQTGRDEGGERDRLVKISPLDNYFVPSSAETLTRLVSLGFLSIDPICPVMKQLEGHRLGHSWLSLFRTTGCPRCDQSLKEMAGE